MKNLKKYFVVLGLFLFAGVAANAEVSVKDTISPEFIYNQGYSSEVSRIIEIKTKDPATPIPAETRSVWKRIGNSVLRTIDPAWDSGNEFPSHDTKFDRNHIEDL